MEKDVLRQYADIVVEIEKIREDIQDSEKDLERLVEEGTVVDKVKGGLGGIQGFRIEGFPVPEYERRWKLLRKRVDTLHRRENDLLAARDAVEKFIAGIPASRDRIIFKGVFVDRKTQQELARELHIDRSLVSKIIGKYV